MFELDKIKYSYARTTVWDCDFSLKLKSGDSLGVIGSSGSGKSTLLNLIAGFITPSDGSIIFNEVDYTNKKPSNRPITMLFQEHNLFSYLNVYQNVAIGINPSLNLTPEEIKNVEEALDRVGLKGFNQRYTFQLSGGQRQRIAIARILVRKTPILLLDEPFSFLDPPLRVEMLELVKDLQRERKFTMIMVTHEFSDCISVCNKTAFIDHGRVIHLDYTKKFVENTVDIPKIRGYVGNVRGIGVTS